MNARQLDRLHSILTTRRQQLQATFVRLQQEIRARMDPHPDTADQAVVSHEKNALHAQGDQARRQLRQLDDALRKLEMGTYGECVLCGKEITVARLGGDSLGTELCGVSGDAGVGDHWVNRDLASMWIAAGRTEQIIHVRPANRYKR